MSPISTLAALALFAAGPPADDFRERIAPLLEARCVSCHGEKVAKGGLSLATAEALRAGGDAGPAIVPGDPGSSLLLEKVTGEKPEMPRGGRPLSAAEVADLRRWVEQGANWPAGLALKAPKSDWWAIRPVAKPPTPEVKDRAWPRNPIDVFILSSLEAKGLRPRPEADRRTLIRRLTFDLTGLPPTPEEIDAFLNDKNADAYERLVDRLLGSPRYGERWGRHWLDVARYGDTHGYDKDKRRDHAWPYRDYVIRAFNEDRPYGRFVREQVAGDVLFPGEPEGVIATGFLAAGPWDFVGQVELREGTSDKEKTRLLDRDDMLAGTLSTFSSLTVHCARCHDHKFDPISQKDYYRLQAVFSGVDRGDRPYPSRSAADRRMALEGQRREILGRRDAIAEAIRAQAGPDLAKVDERIAALRSELAALPRPAGSGSPTNGYHSSIHPEPDADAWVAVDLGRSLPIDEVRIVPARPTDFPDTPGFGFPERYRLEIAETADFATSRVVLDGLSPAHDDEPEVVRPTGVSGRYVRVSASRLWKRTDDYVFALSELEVISGGRNVALGAAVFSLDSIEAGRWGVKNLVDGFDSRGARPSNAEARHRLLAEIQAATRERVRLLEATTPPGLRADRDRVDAELAAIDARIAAQPPTEMVYAVLPRPPRPIRLLNRGDVDQPGEAIAPGAPSCVPGLDHDFSTAGADEGARRAALADWLADPRNPLTWRSVVNRIWLHHFGRGIVDTPNDFGRNGSEPSHPALLDWLAAEFRDGGQSWKALHRLIVSSATYRQSSAHDAASAALDGENRLYWRMNRRRLEAEAVRDAILSVAGSLDPTMGGPGYEPFRFQDDHSPTYDHDDASRVADPKTWRRTVYRFAVRSVPDPFVECLDGADPNANTPVRNATITPLQALALLNDPFVIGQSRAFAARVSALSPDDQGRVDLAYRLALGRPATAEERADWSAFASKHGLPNACRMILNLDEFLFLD